MQNNQTVGEYAFPSLCTETVSPLLLSRSLLLRLCSCYLVSGHYEDGIALIEQVYYNLRSSVDKSIDDPEKIFAMHGHLATTDLKTVFTDRFPDSELIFHYIQFLLLIEDVDRAVYVLSILPHGIKSEPDFLLIAAYLISSVVSNCYLSSY